MDMDRALSTMRRDLEGEWSKLTFKFEIDVNSNGGKSAKATNDSITLRNHDDNICVIFRVYPSGLACCTAIFDKIPDTSSVMALMNEFNRASLFFRVYRSGNGFLTLEQNAEYCDEDGLRKYCSKALYRLCKLADDEDLQRLTRLTS